MKTTLEPPPTDFTDIARYPERTLYGLYSTITHGLDGTACHPGRNCFVLAVVFARKGVAALQEVGLLSSQHVNFPSIDLLGVYPNVEGLSVQAVLVVVAVILLLRNGRKGEGT